jgi:hypothetical protein
MCSRLVPHLRALAAVVCVKFCEIDQGSGTDLFFIQQGQRGTGQIRRKVKEDEIGDLDAHVHGNTFWIKFWTK